MAKRETERSPTIQRVDRRVQLGTFEYKGMHPDGNVGNIPENRLRLLINARLRSGEIIPRGGDEVFYNTADSQSCMYGGGDFQIGTPVRAYMVCDGCPGISSSAGFSIGWVDPDQSPYFQSGVYYTDSTSGLVIATYNGQIYIGQDNILRKFQFITSSYGTNALVVAGSTQDIPLKRFDGFTKISWMENFDGKLFIGLALGNGTSKVVTYNGLEFLDDLTAIDAPSGMFKWRDKLILGFNGSTNAIRIRDAGSSPGSWATVAPGAGTVILHKNGASLLGTAYFVTNNTAKVWSYDGTTLAEIHTVAGGTGTPVLSAICSMNNHILVGDSNSVNNGRISLFDGTTWIDSYLSIGNTVAGHPSIRVLAEYRGNLMVLHTRVGSGGRISVFAGISSSVVETTPDTTAGDFDQLVVN